MTDLYSSVFKWAYRQGENFTTDAFCFLLREMLMREKEFALSLINWICFDSDTFFTANDLPIIETQVRAGSEGIPDISISTESVFVLIEVKKGIDLGPGQLRRYHKMLDRLRSNGKIDRTQLVLLTAFGASFEEDEKPHRKLRWSQIEKRLTEFEFSDPVMSYLSSQFKQFLIGQVMTSEKVSWQLMEGTKSLVALTNMIKQALDNLSIPVQQGSSSWGYRGHFTANKNYWIGVHLATPHLVHFQFQDKPAPKRMIELGWSELDGHTTKTLDLESEQCHFFARAKEQQLDELQRFIKLAFDEAESE